MAESVSMPTFAIQLSKFSTQLEHAKTLMPCAILAINSILLINPTSAQNAETTDTELPFHG